jgi:CheY-like chemotaxis protein
VDVTIRVTSAVRPPTDEEPMPDPAPTLPTVLIVQDEPSTDLDLPRVLSGRGFLVVSAASEADAIALCRAQQLRPSVIVLDVKRPAMDGTAFLDAQATEDLLAGVPIVIASTTPPPGPPSPTVHAVLPKPIELPLLAALIHECCSVPVPARVRTTEIEPMDGDVTPALGVRAWPRGAREG